MSGRRDPAASGSAEAAPAWSHARSRCHESRAGRYAAPGILEPPRPLEQVCAGRPHRSSRTRRCASAASATSRGWSVSPAARSRRLDRKPRGTAALPSRWSSPESAVTPGGDPAHARKTSLLPRPGVRAGGRQKEGGGLSPTGRPPAVEPPSRAREGSGTVNFASAGTVATTDDPHP